MEGRQHTQLIHNSINSTNSNKLDKLIWYFIIIFTAADIFSIAIVQIAAGVLMALFIVKKIICGNYTFLKNSLVIPYTCFILARILAVVLSTDFTASEPSLYKEIVLYFMFFVLISEIDITHKSRVILLLQIIIGSACIAAIYGISVYYFIDRSRITSTTSGYYTLGMYLTATLSLSVLLGRYNEIFFKRVVWWGVNAILAFGILLTYDRLHWVGMTIVVLIAGIFKERKLLVIYIAGVTAAIFFNHTFYERLMMAMQDMNFSERNVIWRGAFMLIWQHPVFGFGTGTFRAIFPLYNEMADKGTSSWHNDFLQVYMEGGLVGLIAFCFLLISIFVKGFSALRSFTKQSNIFQKDLTAALMVCILAFIIGGFILNPITTLLFIIVLSLLAGLVGITRKNL